jgi:hypothetical protein
VLIRIVREVRFALLLPAWFVLCLVLDGLGVPVVLVDGAFIAGLVIVAYHRGLRPGVIRRWFRERVGSVRARAH